MATIPQVTKQTEIAMDEEGNYMLPPGHRLPGWTVDVLLDEGKVDEAREELYRLIDEGVNSGPGLDATPQFYEDILAEVKRAADARR